MSLALIEESAKEVRRLAIAGSPLAVGDFRLKKLVPPLEQAGTKVPVFAQVAKGISDLVNGTEAESASRLLSLSTLLNAILYTQGQTSAAGDFRPLHPVPTTGTSTRTTARVLKPLLQALSTSGGGRLELVKSAVERGLFHDLRLVAPAIQALGDTFPELADLVAEKVLPLYGPGILPRLKATLDLKGKRLDARKLMVLHRADPAGSLECCRTALDEGSVEVKAAAIACLAEHEECLPLVMAQAKAKNKVLRAAALEALARHDRPEITQLFTGLVKDQDLSLLVRPFQTLQSRQVLRALLEEGERVFALVLQGDAIPRYCELLNCLQPRREPEAEQFLLGCLAQAGRLKKVKPAQNSIYGGPELAVRLAGMLADLETPAALQAVLAQRALLPAAAFSQVLRSALQSWTPDQVFAEFSPLLSEKKGEAKARKEELERAMFARSRLEDPSIPEASGVVEWDPRWLDAAIKADERGMVCCLARPGHAAALSYLAGTLASKGRFNHGLTIQALARCGYPKVTDAFLGFVTRFIKSAKAPDYELHWFLSSARHLPPADLPQLEAFAAKLEERFADPFLLAIEPLRPRNSAD